MVCNEVGHGLVSLQPCASGAWVAGYRRLADQAAGTQICQRVDLIDGYQARDTAAAHRHYDLGAVLHMLDIAAEPVVQLADAYLTLQWLGR